VDDKIFATFVKTNAARMELETLQSIVEDLREQIAQRRSGKPPGLKVGSPIEAAHLEFESYYVYGEVVRLSEKGCVVENPGGGETRIRFDKYAVRIISDNDWTWIRKNIEERHDTIKKEIDEEHKADRAELEEIIRRRHDKKRRKISATFADGSTVELYEGTYLHTYRTDWEHHLYGFVVSWTPKSCSLRSRSSDFEEKVHFAKCVDPEVLSDEAWAQVEAELVRRQQEIDVARDSGHESLYRSLSQRYDGAEVKVGSA
jgi:hypothetical protein